MEPFQQASIGRGDAVVPWQTGLCEEAEWSSLETCVEPTRWEFDSTRWNEDPAALATMKRSSRLDAACSQKRETLHCLADVDRY